MMHDLFSQLSFNNCLQQLEQTRLHPFSHALRHALDQRLQDYTHGELEQWLKELQQLPQVTPSGIELKDAVTFGSEKDISSQARDTLKQQLMHFHPWRKGPFKLFGITIDTEWRSDWKWDRLLPHIASLKDKLVLDVGCGNGYHCWRMFGEQAKLVLGIDPSQKFLMQFSIFKHYAPLMPVHLLPLGIEYLPDDLSDQGFDTVFSMGVLYHRRDPMQHLVHLKQLLRPGGQLVLETLIVDGCKNTVFLPSGRYAQMRNVWFLPSALALEHWLIRLGFNNVRVVNINQTSTEEQRATEWMTFHSLKDYLNPNDHHLTIEGYPAPTRAILVAEV